MSYLKQLTQARWFPTITKPLLSGIVASGVVFGLHAVGITDFTSNEATAAATPLVGFIVAAIVQKTGGPTTPVGTVTTTDKPEETLGLTIAQTLLAEVAKEIDTNPTLVKGLAAEALEKVLNPAQTVPTVAREVSTYNEPSHT